MFGPKFDQFREDARAWMTPERAIAMQGIGQGLSQLAMGQAPNLSPAYQAIAERQKAAQMREALQGSGIMDRFTPDQQAVLAQMEPAAAQSIIMQTLFAPPPAPVKGTEINGQLINPVTGEVMGDYRTPDAPEPIIVNDQIINPETYEVVGDYRDEEQSSLVTVNLDPQGETLPEPPKNSVYARDEQGNVMMEPVDLGGGRTGYRPVSIPIAGTSEEQTAIEIEDAQISAIERPQSMLSTIDKILQHPALESATGALAWTQALPNTDMYEFGTYVEQLRGQTAMAAYEDLRGAGDITETELEQARAAQGRIRSGLKPEDFREAVEELQEVAQKGLARARARASERANDLTDDELRDLYR